MNFLKKSYVKRFIAQFDHLYDQHMSNSSNFIVMEQTRLSLIEAIGLNSERVEILLKHIQQCLNIAPEGKLKLDS